jgi:hypothetical protein
MDRNLKKMVSLQLQAAKRKSSYEIPVESKSGRVSASAIESAFDFFGFGFVNSALQG